MLCFLISSIKLIPTPQLYLNVNDWNIYCFYRKIRGLRILNSLLARAYDYHLDNCILYIWIWYRLCWERLRDSRGGIKHLVLWRPWIWLFKKTKTNLCNLFKYRKSTMFIPSVISLLTIIEKFEYEQIDWKKFVYLNLYKL